MRWLALVLALLFSAIPAFGQSTTVSGTITDAGAQAWFSGTVQFTFRPSNSNPTAQYFWNGAPFDKNTTIPSAPLVLDGSGSFSGVSVPSNNFITPSGSTWTVQVCPASTTSCFSQNLSITGATQNISAQMVPPAVNLNLSVPLLGARAYTDSEVTGALPGSLYFNNTDNRLHVCLLTSFPPCTWFVLNGGSGTISGSGAAGQVAVFSGATSIAGDPNFTWGGASVGLIATANNAAQIILTAGLDVLDIDGGSASLNASEPGATATLHGNAGVSITSTSGNIVVGSAGGASGIDFLGSTSGSAVLGPAAVAGTPNRINLPTTTGGAGQALTTNGANPQQTSWSNFVASVTGTANQITSSGGLNPVLSIPATFIAPGTITATTSITDSGLTPSRCVQTGAAGLLTSTAGACASSTAILAAPTVCNLGAPIAGISSGVTTTIIACSTTAPSSGCPCRAYVSWSIAANGTSATEQVEGQVSDGTTAFAGTSAYLSNQVTTGNPGINRSDFSANTYANSAPVTFTLSAVSDHTWTVDTTTFYLTQPTQVRVTYFSSN